MKTLASPAFLAGVLTLAACAVPLAGSERPAADAPATFASAIGTRSASGSRGITPLAVVEDSRCPASVQCIQAGTVRVQVRLEEAGGSRVATVGIRQPAELHGAWLHLIGVCPARTTPQRLLDSDYRFTFTISDAAHPPHENVSCG
jgi:hypothetical protein